MLVALKPFVRGLAFGLSFLAMGSCVDLEPKLKEMEAQIDQLRNSNANLAGQVTTLRNDHDELSRLVGCANPQVRDFMRACVSRHNFVCSVQSVESALRVMTSIPHIMAYVWPDGPPALALERVGQFKELMRKHTRLSTTRLLVVAAPAGTTATETSQAEQVALRIRNQVINELYPQSNPGQAPLPTLPPLLLGCRERDELLRRYQQILPNRDTPFANEPKPNQKRIVLWFFLVDC